MDKEIYQRHKWAKMYEEHGNAGPVCLRYGISRPTLWKLWRRYKEADAEGLKSLSRRPKPSPFAKVGATEEGLILQNRRARNLGARCMQSELKRVHVLSLSASTTHKVLTRNQVKPLCTCKYKKSFINYSRPLPRDRIQMDTCKIGPGLYQYTAIDDYTRYRVLRLYKRRTAVDTINFIEDVLEEKPFPVQSIQTDRGAEFFAYRVQESPPEWRIKFRPNRTAAPHLNGKAERSQKTNKLEFYPAVDLDHPELDRLLGEWQHCYNWQRPHSAFDGKTPMDRYFDLIWQTPYREDALEGYNPEKELYRIVIMPQTKKSAN